MRLTPKTGWFAAAFAGATMAVMFAAAPARADVVGDLRCVIAPGTGAIVVSQRPVTCTFASPVGPTQRYAGFINRLGVDIGVQTSGVLVYNVVALGTPAPGSLAGDYIGPGFGVTLGTGGGLNALVGGGNSFTLQPISATTSTGVNINAGIGELHLNFVGLDTGPRARRYHRHSRRGAYHRHHRRHR